MKLSAWNFFDFHLLAISLGVKFVVFWFENSEFFKYKNLWFFNFLKTEISVDYPHHLYEERRM